MTIPTARFLFYNDSTMREVVLRHAVRRDRDSIRRMSMTLLEEHRRLYGSDVSRGRSTERYISRLVASHVRKGAVIVAETDGDLIGFVLLSKARFTIETTRPAGSITDIWVEPEYRAQGVGTRLMTAGLHWLRAQGYERVVLNVASGNQARSLYARLGFNTFSESMELDLGTLPD